MVCRELSVELKLLMPKIKLFKDCLWRDGSHNINQAEVRARRNSNSIHGHLRREGSSSQARRTRNGTQLFNFLFQGFDWEGLDSRSLDPPITPKVFFINSSFLCFPKNIYIHLITGLSTQQPENQNIWMFQSKQTGTNMLLTNAD